MKAVILAGGFGTRISEETDLRPKPMVEIGGRPLIWHIMKMYSNHGINEFIVCLGYKSHVIKDYFANYRRFVSDMSVNLSNGEVDYSDGVSEDWQIQFVETGLNTQTGGRLKGVSHLISETFCLTYGDGVSDLDIKGEINFHKSHGLLATVAAVKPPGRFAVLEIEQNSKVRRFREKPEDEVGWINGGFFVLEPGVFDYIESDNSVWEREPMENLASSGNLAAYKHSGFWHSVDTLRDKRALEEAYLQGAPWLNVKKSGSESL